MKRFFYIVFLAIQCICISAQTLNYPIEEVNGQKFYLYRAERSIGLYRISINFGVTQADIIKYNPQLKERGLHYDELIRIPVVEKKDSTTATPKKVATETTNTKVTKTNEPTEKPLVEKEKKEEEKNIVTTENIVVTIDSIADTTAIEATTNNDAVADETKTDTNEIVPVVTEQHVTRIALMLPFQANNTKRDQNMDRFVEFYEGALLAMNDLQKDGQKYELHVYDTEKSESKVESIIHSGALNSMDAIIGLAYPLQLMVATNWAKNKHIPVLAPFTDHIEGIESNPYVLQFNSTTEQEAQAIVKWMLENKNEINCVLVDAKDADIPQSVRVLRQQIVEKNVPYTTTTLREILNDSIYASLKDGVNNILIFNTEKYSNIQLLLPRIENSKGNKQVTIYGKYSWSKENLTFPLLCASIFTTDVPADLKHYTAMHQHYFAEDATSVKPRFDLLGYDLTRELVAYLQGKEYYGLQSDVHFDRISDKGGYINTNITILLQ